MDEIGSRITPAAKYYIHTIVIKQNDKTETDYAFNKKKPLVNVTLS